jgi:hypothetical protein
MPDHKTCAKQSGQSGIERLGLPHHANSGEVRDAEARTQAGSAAFCRRRIWLTFSHATADYRLCGAGKCRMLGDLLKGLPDWAPVEIKPCS